MIDVGIDPGVLALGYGIAWGRRLGAAGICTHIGRLDVRAAGHALQIRDVIAAAAARGGPWQPTIFLESMTAARDRATTAQDLIDVQTVGCLTAAALGYVRLLPPSEWKGSTPKVVHHERMIEALDAGERAILAEALRACPKRHHKEVLDAVGILLYGLGRIERTGKART